MEIKTIEPLIYENYLEEFPERNFLQSSYQGHKMSLDHSKVIYLAAYDGAEMFSAAMICVRSLLRIFTYAYAPRGILFKSEDHEKIKAFYDSLKKYLSINYRCVYLVTDPYIELRQRDKDGNIVANGRNSNDYLKAMQDYGFIHEKLNFGYDFIHQCRFMSVLDLKDQDRASLMKNMDAQTRQNVKNALKNNVKIRYLKKEELSLLSEMVHNTGERRHFQSFKLDYYEKMYDSYGDKVRAYYAYLDINEYLERLSHDYQQEETAILENEEKLKENPHSKNAVSRLKVARSNLAALTKRLDEAKILKEKYGDELGLASALFIFYGQEVIYLTSGSNNEYKKFKGPYALQWYMIQKALDEGFRFYNFYGISGYFNEGEEGYGVFNFKRGFNATVVELVGVFKLPIKPFIYRLFTIKKRLLKY